MSSNFECFVAIRDQKYELVLNETDLSLISFQDIYPKIKQIVRIALNEDIDINTHEFEIFENYSSKGLVVRLLNELIGHKSLIQIRPQEICYTVVANHTTIDPLLPQTDQKYEPLVSPPPNAILLSQLTNPLTSVIHNPQNSENEAIKYNHYCDVCPALLSKTTYPSLIKYRLNVSRNKFQTFAKFFEKVAEISDNTYSKVKGSHWKDIPQYMEQFDENGSGQGWKLSKFMSYLHIYFQKMKESPNPVIACNLFPFFHYFEAINFDSEEEICKKINAFREKLRGCLQHSSQLYLESEELKSFRQSVNKLENEENVKEFHSMAVLVINIDCNLKKDFNESIYWQKICDKLVDSGYSMKCQFTFEKWIKFYANNYERLNGKLEPKHQKTFDLLKVIHLLDFKKVMKKYAIIWQKIVEISEKPEFKEYFDKHLTQIQNQKSIEILANDENDLKAFYQMVVNIDIRANFRKANSKQKSFKQLSETMKSEGYPYSPQDCEKLYHKWAQFYAQNFDQMNGKLDEKHQKIFDLLKVIHILELNKMPSKRDICKKITEISSREDIIEYYGKHLSDIRIKKLETIGISKKKHLIPENNFAGDVQQTDVDIDSLPQQSIPSESINHSFVSESNQITEQLTSSSMECQPVFDLTNTSSAPQMTQTNEMSSQEKESYEENHTYNHYCSVCPVQKITETIPNKCRLIVNRRKFEKYLKLFEKIAEISDNNYSKVTEKHWVHDIPYYMSQFEMPLTNGKKEWVSKRFKKLLRKYVQVLKFCSNPVIACNVFALYHNFEAINFDSNDILSKEVNALRTKRKESSQLPQMRSEFQKDFDLWVKKLNYCEKDIKQFKAIIDMIDINWDLRKDVTISPFWQQICDKLMAEGYSHLMPTRCKRKFHEWIYFYSQTYDELNGNLEPNLQKTFDLLKAIHILDLRKVVSHNSTVYHKIVNISERQEFKEYYEKHLKDLKLEKFKSITNLKTNEMNLISTNKQQSITPIPITIDLVQNDSHNSVEQSNAILLVNPETYKQIKSAEQLESQSKRSLETDDEVFGIIISRPSNSEGNHNPIKKQKTILTICLD